MNNLRPYQKDCISNIMKGIKSKIYKQVIVMATGCLTGDTIINLNTNGNGKRYSLVKAYKLSQNKRGSNFIKNHLIRSFDGEKVTLKSFEDIVYSGKKQVWKIILKNGNYLKGTSNHKILTERGWIELGKLKLNSDIVLCDQLLPIKSENKKQKKLNYLQTWNLWYHPFAIKIKRKNRPKGYTMRVEKHRIVYEASLNNVTTEKFINICRNSSVLAKQLKFINPQEYHIHHKDNNIKNNSLTNLQKVTCKEHCKKHNWRKNFKQGIPKGSLVVTIKKLTFEDTFDIINVGGEANFIANGIIVHNCGKTFVFGQLPPMIKQQGKKTLILAHREELLNQAKEELEAIEPSLKIEIEQAERKVLNEDTDVVIASIQTIGRSNSTRIQKFNPDDFGLIIIDECHHSTAETYKNVLRYFEVLKEEDNNSDKILLGVTATPNRSDHTGLDVIFDEITFNYSLQQGIKENYLSNIKAFTVETKNDISGVGTRMGEFIDAELSDAINTENRNKLIVETYKELTPDTKALVFASNVEHTVSLAEVFKSAGIRVGYILGSTNKEERKELLRKFKTGEKKVIINCNVLSEGFNEPSIETILMARPTKSSVNYSQQVGRGTRIFENKTHLNLVDFVDNLGNNNIVTLPTLFGCQATLKGTKGKFITEIAEKIESIKEVNPDYDVSNITDWDDNENIDKVIKEINIFEQARIPIEAKKYSTYSWLRKQDGFVLKLPPKDEQYYSLEIKQNMLDRYEFIQKEYFKVIPNRFNKYRSWKKVNETIEHKASNLEDIFKKSDNFIKDNFQEYSIILNQKGSWRADAPSDKQLSMLKKFKIAVPANLSKGDASILIGKYLQGRNNR